MKKSVKFLAWAVIALYVLSFLGINAVKAVWPGYRGVVETAGYVHQKSYENGPLVTIPFSKLHLFNVREQAFPFTFKMKTAGMQYVVVKGTINYQLNGDNVHKLFLAVGENYQPVLITPLLEGALTQCVGKQIPEFIVSNPEMISEAVSYIVADQWKQTEVISLCDLRLFSPKFSDAFEKSIEDKAIAQQVAEKAKIETQRVEEEAKQMLLRAEAEGKALKLKSDALRNPLIVQYEVAKALGNWKGNLPNTLVLGQGALPILNGTGK